MILGILLLCVGVLGLLLLVGLERKTSKEIIIVCTLVIVLAASVFFGGLLIGKSINGENQICQETSLQEEIKEKYCR